MATPDYSRYGKPVRLRVIVSCDTDAFAPDPRREAARILRNIADRIEMDDDGMVHHFQTVLDADANDVGRFALGDEP